MNKQKKILILGKLPPPYMGPSVATEILLGSELSKRYHLLHVDTRGVDDLSSFGKMSIKKAAKFLFSYIGLIRTHLKHRPDLTLIPVSQSVRGYLKDAIYILITRILKRPYVVQVRGSEFGEIYSEGPWCFKGLVRCTAGRANGAIVLSDRLKFMFDGILPNDRVFTAQNGLNLPEKMNIPRANTFSVLSLCNLMPRKGIEDVVRAAAMLQRSYPGKVSCTIAGSWSTMAYKKEIESIVEAEGGDIVFFGVASGEAKRALLSKADVLIFTPRKPEGMPWVVIEALAAGLPVIVTDKGAIADCVEDGENGFIVPDSAPEEIARSIEILLKEESLRSRMSLNSINRHQKYFTEEKMVEKYILCFEKVMDDA